MAGNTVLETTKKIIISPSYVQIDSGKLEETAQRFAQEKLEIPKWDAPVFPEVSTDNNFMQYMFLGNSINFAFTDFETGKKYATQFMGKEWSGAYGMWAALMKAHKEGVPILDANYLSNISEQDMRKIFQGNFEIPMFQERLNIFREVGTVLKEKYRLGLITDLIVHSGDRLFNNGRGVVERITSDFPSFDDSVLYKGETVRFDKRAQLFTGMLFGRCDPDFQKAFPNIGPVFEDIDELTVFADYVLPKGLRDLGILKYSDSLAKRVDGQQLIPAGSQEELEIRASTIHAAKMLQDRINEINPSAKANALNIDYKLWGESRKKPGFHHLTRTIAY